METLREYLENKKSEEILSEGVLEAIGTVLGIGTAGLLYAWMAALLFKGGVGAAKSFKSTFGKAKETFNIRELKKEKMDSPAVKQQEEKINKREEKFAPDCAELVEAIKAKDWQKAHEIYHSLPLQKQNSTEFKKFVIEEIVKVCGAVIVSSPTPGSPTFIGIRRTIDLPTAKIMAAAFESQFNVDKNNKTE